MKKLVLAMAVLLALGMALPQFVSNPSYAQEEPAPAPEQPTEGGGEDSSE